MIPVFSMLRAVPLVNGNDIWGQGGSGLLDTYAGLIIPFVAGSFGVFLCRQFYVGFPRELDDAATLFVSLPVYLLFAFLQKYFVNGILAGSIKG